MKAPEDGFDVWDPANVSPFVAYLATADCPFTGETFLVQGGKVQRVQSWTAAEAIDKGDRWTVDELARRGPEARAPAEEVAGRATCRHVGALSDSRQSMSTCRDIRHGMFGDIWSGIVRRRLVRQEIVDVIGDVVPGGERRALSAGRAATEVGRTDAGRDRPGAAA